MDPIAPTTSPTTSRPAGLARKIIWLFVLAIGGLLYGVGGLDLAGKISFDLGQCIGVALLVWVVFYFVAARNRVRRWFSALTFLVILISITSGGVVNLAGKRQQLALISDAIQKIYKETAEAEAAGLPLPKVPIEPVAIGEFGEIERVIRVTLNHMADERGVYQRSIDEIGWDRILDPQRISRDSTLAESRTMARKAKEATAAYRERMRTLPDRIRADFNKLPLRDRSRREFVAGFQRGVSESGNRLSEQLELESRVIDEVGAIIDLLAETKGQWAIQNGQFEVANDATLSRFNAHLDQIEKTAQRQEAFRNESRDAMTSLMRKLAN